MSSRNLPIPRQALGQALTTLSNTARRDRLRKKYPGRVRLVEALSQSVTTVQSETPVANKLAWKTRLDLTPLDPGAWTIYARARLYVSQTVASALFTGRERLHASLQCAHVETNALIQEIDFDTVSPAATPEVGHPSGALWTSANLFGVLRYDERCSVLLLAETVDFEEAAHTILMDTRIMAVPA